MGRGSSDQRSMAKGLMMSYGADYANAKQDRNSLRSSLMPRAESLAQEGPLPEESALQNRTLEAIRAAGDSAGQQMDRRSAMTHNGAGLFANKAATALGTQRESADAMRGLAAQRLQRRMLGTQMLGNMYGIDTNWASNMAGLPVQALGQHAQGISRIGFGFGPLSMSAG